MYCQLPPINQIKEITKIEETGEVITMWELAKKFERKRKDIRRKNNKLEYECNFVYHSYRNKQL